MSDTLLVPPVSRYSPDGTLTTYAPGANTDIGRGTALLAAFTASGAGDTIIAGYGKFDVGTSQIRPPDYVSFSGQGMNRTWILSQRDSQTDDGNDTPGNPRACMNPGSYSDWGHFTLYANSATRQQSPFGAGVGDRAVVKVELHDAHIIAAVDNIHMTIETGNRHELRCERCRFDSNFDTIACVTAAAGSKLELVDCHAFVQYPHPLWPYPGYLDNISHTTRAIAVINSAWDVIVRGGSYTTGGGGDTTNSAVFQSAGTLTMYGATIRSAGTNALDIQGTVSIGPDVVYDPSKKSGTATVLKTGDAAIGSGSDQCTVAVTNSGTSLPIADADVWVSTDSAGANVVAGTLQTDSLGNATFLLDAGDTYYLWMQKDGENPILGRSFTAVAD